MLAAEYTIAIPWWVFPLVAATAVAFVGVVVWVAVRKDRRRP